MRNKEKTKRKLIAALGTVVKREGLKNVGVNKVAEAAGVSKILIYRYFGGFNELLRVYQLEMDFLKKCLSADPSTNDFRKAIYAQVSKILNEQSDDIYSHCEIEALLLDDICNSGEIATILKRELPANPTIYFELLSTLLAAGTDHLIINEVVGNQGKQNVQSANQQQDMIQSLEQIVDWTLG